MNTKKVPTKKASGSGARSSPSADGGAPRGPESSEKFDRSWAIVELTGHRKLAGRVSVQISAGTPLLRIDVPEILASGGVVSHPAFTTFYGASSIYSLTLTTEEVVRRFCLYWRELPI